MFIVCSLKYYRISLIKKYISILIIPVKGLLAILSRRHLRARIAINKYKSVLTALCNACEADLIHISINIRNYAYGLVLINKNRKPRCLGKIICKVSIKLTITTDAIRGPYT